jgi:hypothetical protein
MLVARYFVVRSRPACAVRDVIMLLVGELPSIHDLSPLEEGGPVARAGFLYQDHIGARFCIEMLQNANLVGVWCETLDDITLIWATDGGGETVEFVQVKSNELDQMWSIALICDGGNARGRSLLLVRSDDSFGGTKRRCRNTTSEIRA